MEKDVGFYFVKQIFDKHFMKVNHNSSKVVKLLKSSDYVSLPMTVNIMSLLDFAICRQKV